MGAETSKRGNEIKAKAKNKLREKLHRQSAPPAAPALMVVEESEPKSISGRATPNTQYSGRVTPNSQYTGGDGTDRGVGDEQDMSPPPMIKDRRFTGDKALLPPPEKVSGWRKRNKAGSSSHLGITDTGTTATATTAATTAATTTAAEYGPTDIPGIKVRVPSEIEGLKVRVPTEEANRRMRQVDRVRNK